MSIESPEPESGRRMSRRSLAVGAGAAASAVLCSAISRPGSAQEGGWRQVAADAAGPPPRWDHTLSPHDAGKGLIVFGGRDVNGAALSDTWLFSRSRFSHAVATDQGRELMYLFGG